MRLPAATKLHQGSGPLGIEAQGGAGGCRPLQFAAIKQHYRRHWPGFVRRSRGGPLVGDRRSFGRLDHRVEF